MEVGKGGLHSVAVEVTDSFGNTGRTKSSFFGGEALPSGALVPHGVGAAITAEGLDLVTEVIEAELAPEKTDLGAKLAAANPIWSGKKSIFSAELSVTSASYTGLDLSLASVAGGLKVGAKLDDLFVALKAKIKAGFTFTVSGSVTADEATLAGKVLAGKSPEGGLVFLLPSMDVSLSGFSFDIAKFPDALESLASKAVEKFLEKKLAELIRDKVPPLLERELGDLLVARSISVDGHPLDVGGSLEALGFAPTGIEAVFGTSVKATEPDPFHEPLGGFLYTPNPTLPPEHITSSMFYLAVSDDTLNQALYEAYRAGALTFDLAETIEVKGTVKDLTFGFLESYLGKDALADAGIGPSTPITLGFDAMLPPVIHFRKGAEGLAVISVHDLKLTISAGSVKLFGFELDLTLPVGIKILGDAKLSPVLYPESSKIDFRIVGEPLIDLDNDLFEPMLGDLAKAVMPSLVAAIDGFPLPKIASLSLSGVVLETHGDYLQVFADLLGEDTSGPKTSGSFSALSYNVAGLPEGLSSSSPFTYSPQISPLLNKYDLVLVQEDFFYHEQLITEIAHPFTSDTLVDYIKLYKLAPDGLNRFSRIPFSEHTRRIWAVTHGYLDNGSDALSAKGFSFARHELAPGVYLDVYNLHADAGGSAGDVAARAVQYKQLSDFIAAHSAGHAVVVGGDTNLDGFDPKDEPVLAAFMSDAKLTDVARHLGTKIEMIDRFFFRSSSTLTISPTRWRVATEFVTAEGEPLSDHPALHVDFAWKVVSGG